MFRALSFLSVSVKSAKGEWKSISEKKKVIKIYFENLKKEKKIRKINGSSKVFFFFKKILIKVCSTELKWSLTIFPSIKLLSVENVCVSVL